MLRRACHWLTSMYSSRTSTAQNCESVFVDAPFLIRKRRQPATGEIFSSLANKIENLEKINHETKKCHHQPNGYNKLTGGRHAGRGRVSVRHHQRQHDVPWLAAARKLCSGYAGAGQHLFEERLSILQGQWNKQIEERKTDTQQMNR